MTKPAQAMVVRDAFHRRQLKNRKFQERHISKLDRLASLREEICNLSVEASRSNCARKKLEPAIRAVKRKIEKELLTFK